MEKKIITFTADEQSLRKTGGIPNYASNKVSYIEAQFELGENWQGFDAVRAIWYNKAQTISMVLADGKCIVPYEVLANKGQVMVNLVGSISENDVLTDRLTTYPVVALIVDADAKVDGSNTQPITPSQFEQFVEAVKEDADRAEQGASDAEQSAQNAETSATSASESAESAHNDKVEIEQAIAEVIQQIEDFEQVQVVVNTLPPTSPATSDFTDGVLTLGIPQGAKGDTGNGIASCVLNADYTLTINFTDGTSYTTTSIRGAQGVKGDTGNGISSITKTGSETVDERVVDTYTTTFTDGETTEFKVTNGKDGEVTMSQLDEATIVQTLSDNEPYHFRATPKCGSRQLDTIVGGSVGWNQLHDTSRASESSNGITLTNNGDGTWTVSGTATADTTKYTCVNLQTIKDHIYYVSMGLATVTGSYRVGDFNNVIFANGVSAIVRKAGNSGATLGAQVYNGVTIDKKLTPQVIDLTLALGSTIADYVYSLEQSTSGSGVAWLKRYFDLDSYHPYDSGSIQSVSGLVSHDCVGFNQWDEETQRGYYDPATGEYSTLDTNQLCSKNMVKCLPNTTYYAFNGSNSSQYNVVYYDANGDYLAVTDTTKIRPYFNATFTTPSDARYFNFNLKTSYGTTYNHDICINISSDRNGQYEPYEKHSYPLDNTLTLRGIPKLADGKMYYDGDVYESDGTVNRKYGVVDLGTLNWAYQSGSTRFYSEGISGSVKAPSTNGDTIGVISSRYSYTTLNNLGLSSVDKACAISTSKNVYIKDTSYSDATALKNSLSGVYMVYELATPTTETATPYTNPQLSYDGGTEEYVSDCIVPIGHETEYPMTLTDTMPTADGTYTMSVTITNGKPVISWTASRSLMMARTVETETETETETEETETETEQTEQR